MRKSILILIIIIYQLISCEKYVEPSDEGMIIGKWAGTFQKYELNDGTFVDHIDTCRLIDINVFEDGSLKWIDFFWVKIDACAENTETEIMGEWNRISNHKYEFILKKSSDQSYIIIKPEDVSFYFNGVNSMELKFEVISDESAPENAKYYYMIFFKE